jgi:hypothetical protein
LLVRRVLDQGWTLTAAAAAAGVSVRCAREWLRRFLAEGEPGLLDRSVGAAPGCHSHPAGAGRRDRGSAAAADARPIAETLSMPLSTRREAASCGSSTIT